MFKELKKFREDRHIENIQGNVIGNLLEELTEYSRANNVEEQIDALCDIVVFSINAIEAKGFDAEISMLETCKEINSRDGSFNKELNKWVKDKSPEAQEKWYKADYKKAIKHN